MNYIYETPWWLPSGLLVLGIVLFVTGNNRLDRRVKLYGVVLAALGILLGLVSWLLESPREKAIARTRALVAAVEKRDWNKMQSLLHPEIALIGWKGRAEIVEGAKYYSDRYGLRNVTITGIDAEQVDDRVAVSMAVTADGTITKWRLEWVPSKDGLVLSIVEALGGPLIDASQLEGRFRPR